MKNSSQWSALVFVLGMLTGPGALPAQNDPGDVALPQRVTYNRHIRPILSAACFQCHGPDAHARKAGRRLDTFAGATAEQDGVRALVPGQPGASDMLRRVRSESTKEHMPPARSKKPSLTPQQIALLERWIAQGATYEKHWSFLAPQSPPLPTVVDAGGQGPLDRFVAKRLRSAGLQPSPAADRRTLIRRVTFDLTGLPPRPAEVQAFLADTRPDAYERVVDRLLASPGYGERMAVGWMDAARFADTSAYHADGPRQMWAWRDWVIDAFQGNMRYDRFTTEQLAGDLLPGATVEQKVASAFNRNHCTSDEGGAFPEELRVGYVVDRVRTTSMVWLGLTMECSQCHSHKYDPISQREYYSFYAFFNRSKDPGMQTRTGNQSPVVGMVEAEKLQQAVGVRERIAAIRGQREVRDRQARPGFDTWLATQPADRRLPTGVMLAHYPLDQDLGNAAATEPAAAPAATEDREPQWVEGKFGSGLQCGEKKFVDLGDMGDFERTDRFSVGLWVRPQSKRVGAPVARMNPGHGHRGWDLYCGGGKPVSVHLIHRWSDDAIKVTTRKSLAADRWQHVCVTYDGSSRAAGFRVYVDGELWPHRAEQDRLRGTTRSKVPLYLGRRKTGSVFIGGVDDLRLFGRTLSAVEAASLAGGDPVGELLETPVAERKPEQEAAARAVYLARFDPEWCRLGEQLAAEEETLRKLEEPYTTVMVMSEMGKPRDTFVLARGSYDQPTEEKVEPDVPASLPPLGDRPRNRLGLARWLTDPQNPLTARVTVNRFWYQVFGRGLVATLEDFGAQGAFPSHPDLLDWLAVDFVSHGWDVKRLMRQLVTSSTYRQSARVTDELLRKDPENVLLARGPRLRLPAEFLRDQALAVSGLLVDRIGGPGVKPYQPPGLWNEVSLDKNVRFVQDHGDKLYRRSLYTYWKRSAPPPSMRIFDAPTREQCVVRRPRTNTPLQALVTLNDPQFLEAARFLAQRMIREGRASVAERVGFAYRWVLSREPRREELEVFAATLEPTMAGYRADEARAKELLAVGESPRDDAIDPAEHAAWMVVASMILNLDEALTK